MIGRTALRGVTLGVMAVVLLAGGAANAGQSCEKRPPDPTSVASGMALAAATTRALDANGAAVVLLARAGQDLSKYGLAYSHLGFAYRETMDGKPVWRVLHKLNHCGTAESALYRQGLGEFFLDNPYRYEAAFVTLSSDLQVRLLPLLRNNALVGTLSEPHYSMVAYAWGQSFQQSNQWALETLAGALDPAASTRARAQAWLQLHDYQPTVLHIDALTRLGGRMTRANVAFDDHPDSKRFSDHIETVTVESMFAWMQRMQIAGRPTLVR